MPGNTAQSAYDQPPESANQAEPEVAGLPPLPPIAPADIMGYSRAELVSALGAPVFRRVDKGSEMLRFQGQGCVLDVYLYPDMNGPAGPDGKTIPGHARIAHLEARDVRGFSMEKQACLGLTPRARG
ncbi:MAG: hypothetical protein VW268_06075 [Rhodospirillaceae bacterium]